LFDDAHYQLQQGYYDKAIAEAGDGYRQTAEKKDILWAWRFRILRAEALTRNRQAKESVESLTEDPPASLPVEVRARKKLVLGMALCQSDRQRDGESILGEAEKIIPADSHSLQAELAFDRGYCSFASPPVAKQYFQKAAELAGHDDPFLAASSLGNIGFMLEQDGRSDEAAEWFQKVLPLAEVSKSKLLKEKALGSLGNVYSELGDFKQSIEKLEEAQRIASEIGRQDDEQRWLVTLGRSYQAVPGEYTGKAEPEYLRALTIALQLHDADIAQRCLHNLTALALDEHDFRKAKDYWQKEIATRSPERGAQVDGWLDEARIAVGEDDLGKAEQLFKRIDQDPRTNPSRRAFVEDQLGKVYWKERRNAEADRMFLQGIHTVETEVAKLKEPYRASFVDENGHRFDDYIRFLVSQRRELRALEETEHLRELARSGLVTSSAAKLSLAVLRNRLQANQVILYYHVTDEESFLWLIARRQLQLFRLQSHPELYALIDRHNKNIQDQRGMEDSIAGQELYNALIQPAENLIPKNAHVTIVPSKILWLLNFETLIVPHKEPHYWIEDVVVQNANSLSEGPPSAGERSHSSKEMLLIGAPQEVNPAFPSLKHAADEIARVENHFAAGQREVVSGATATPQAYQKSDPKPYRYLHFVTHGIPNERVPLESAIVLSGTDNSYKLYGREIIATPLNADLVTISACYGAGKRWYVSEGMVGLAWAFMRAGAHEVVAALWEVDDASTPELMDHFYEGLSRHHSAAEALHLAKINMLQSKGPRSLPYFWGSLQLYAH
jgi:CHAT domain-containing protein